MAMTRVYISVSGFPMLLCFSFLFLYLYEFLDVFATLGAQDVISLSQEASAHERYRALLAVETVVVPLALLERDILAPSKP